MSSYNVSRALIMLAIPALAAGAALAAEPSPAPVPLFAGAPRPAAQGTQAAIAPLTLLGGEPIRFPKERGETTFENDPVRKAPCFVVAGQQSGYNIAQPAFLTPDSVVRWSWKKEQGQLCLVQFQVKNPHSGQSRYVGYAAGTWTEPPSADPTVEFFVATSPPRQWTECRRNLYQDVRNLLGWDSIQLTAFFLSPWDGQPGRFADMTVAAVASTDVQEQKRRRELADLSLSGRGHYIPQRLKQPEEKRIERLETTFEECAPSRNSGANEWSAFGAEGNMDFNCMGRRMWVRYPAFELVFRLYDGPREIEPGDLESFRLGLIDDRLPAIWGGWAYGGLLYKVSVLTVPHPAAGNFDLYRLDVQNPAAAPLESKLVAGFDGPPDLRLDDGVVRGLGDAPFAIVDPPAGNQRTLRDWGLCDKRAKAYSIGGGPGPTEPDVGRYRIGLDGLSVVYRFRAEPGKKYKVYLVSTPHISGHLLQQPKKPGDWICEYKVEGCPPKTLDYIDYLRAKSQPLCAGFGEATDADGDGFIEVRSGVAAASKIKHTRLSVIYVFPAGTPVNSPEDVYSGRLNAKCVHHINVGATPEQESQNQTYDASDVGLARLKLRYGESIGPGQTRTFYLRVPSIHRREPVSMGYIAHAFRDVLPGEAVPPVPEGTLKTLASIGPGEAESLTRRHWSALFNRAAKFDLPDPVLRDIFLSRLATRAILDVNLNDQLSFNPCSPFFYFDHAYRDQAYVVYAYDLAGLHDRAEKLLRVYCRNTSDVPPGPIAFDGKPVQLGMLPSGLWNTRPGQWDTQGENLWALVQHYKLSGDRTWLSDTAYPFIRRGAQWLINSRHKHMAEVKDSNDPRYGLLEPGAMEVMEVGKGMHMYYLNAFGVLGLREAADAAAALGHDADARLFAAECRDLKQSLHRSFVKTFKRTGLYEGHLFFGVEPEGVGMYGFWAHNCLLWPCRAIDPRDPMLEATMRRMEWMSNQWGGGMHSEGAGGFWPYIGVDRAVSHILRGEPDKALDYFCAYTDTAGGTFSWGEGYGNLIAGGDQPHFWADGQWVNLFRQLFAFEDEGSLWLTPALFRRWHEGGRHYAANALPTHFGTLELDVHASADGGVLEYTVRVTPRGDQDRRPLEKILLYPRLPTGKAIRRATLDGRELPGMTRDCVVLPRPARGAAMHIRVEAGNW